MIAVAVLTMVSTTANAQKKSGRPPKLPQVETLSLLTKDDVTLACSYYPGTEGKESVCVVLIHGWEGQKSEYHLLATHLQKKGHSVVIPDMRGRGGSTSRQEGERQVTISQNRMRTADLRAMVQYDLEAVKSFLLDENNDQQLNIELTCVVAVDMGCVVALNWIARDWNWPQLPTLKQGQDVKAFVLISPVQSFKGLTTRAVFDNDVVRSRLSAMVIYGKKDAKAASDGRRVYNNLKRFHAPIPADRDARVAKQDLFMIDVNSHLQGVKLTSHPDLEKPRNAISKFIEYRLVNKRNEYPWALRGRP